MGESKRKFYVTDLYVRVLSEEPVGDRPLGNIAENMVNGDLVGHWGEKSVKIVSGKKAVRILEQVGSDPSFFQLNDKGEDL